jgi:DNA polymerase-1
VTRYLATATLSPESSPAERQLYADVLGAEYDQDVTDLLSVTWQPGDVAVVGPWTDPSWLPAWVSIEVLPDDTPPSTRDEPLSVALRESGCPVGLRNDPPKTPRSQYWERYWEAVRWAERARVSISAQSSDVAILQHTGRVPCEIVTEGGRAVDIVRSLHGRPFGWDLETDSLVAADVSRVGIALSDGAQAWWLTDRATDMTALHALTELLRDSAGQPRGSNLKYDLGVLHALTSAPLHEFAPQHDTQIKAWLADPTGYQYGLKHLTRKYLKQDVLELDDVGGPLEFWNQPHDLQALYAAQGDAANSYDLVDMLDDKLASLGLTALYDRIEAPVIPVLAEMELAGITVDRARLTELFDEYMVWMHSILDDLHALGFDGNPNADAVVARWLYGQPPSGLGLPMLERTPSGKQGSVKGDVLRQLYVQLRSDAAAAREARAVKLLLDWSEVEKAMNTFLVPPMESDVSVVHPTISQTAAKTGRLAFRRPNMQQVPARGRRAEIRGLYVAPDGCDVVDADYAQIEPRLGAHFSHDPLLVNTFKTGGDVYQQLGLRMGFPLDTLGKHSDRRTNIKTTYLADQYGTSPLKIVLIALKDGIELTVSEARDTQRGIHEASPAFYSWRESQVALARRNGFVRDILFGRRRNVGGLHAVDPGTRDATAREVMNWNQQAGAGGILKGALPAVAALFREAGGHLNNTVHDEVVGYVPHMPTAERAVFEHELAKAMCWVELSVPLVVEIGWGTSWLTAKS